MARALARRLDLDYLDTGAMYRGVTSPCCGARWTRTRRNPWSPWQGDLELDVVDTQVTVDGVDASLEIRGRR